MMTKLEIRALFLALTPWVIWSIPILIPAFRINTDSFKTTQYASFVMLLVVLTSMIMAIKGFKTATYKLALSFVIIADFVAILACLFGMMWSG